MLLTTAVRASGRNSHEFPTMRSVKSFSGCYLVALGNLIVYLYSKIGKRRPQELIQREYQSLRSSRSFRSRSPIDEVLRY